MKNLFLFCTLLILFAPANIFAYPTSPLSKKAAGEESSSGQPSFQEVLLGHLLLEERGDRSGARVFSAKTDLPLPLFALLPYLPASPALQGEQAANKRDRTEWKTYQHRLNKLTSTFQQAKINEVRTLYQALMTDIRREIAQVKATNVLNSHSIKYTDKLQASSTPSSRSLRLLEMQNIQKELRKRRLSPENKMQAEDKEVFALLREFGSLMKAELLDQ